MSTPVVAARRSLARRIKSLTAACVTAVMVTTLTQQVPALAQSEPGGAGGQPERQAEPIPPVPVREVAPAASAGAPELATAADEPTPVWPAGGTGVAVVPAAPVRPAGARPVPDGGVAEPAQPVVAGGLPVRADRAAGPAPGRVHVEVFDRATTARAGINGVLLRATPQDAAGRLATGADAVRLSVDYSAFATGYGADWASRLRLVVLPECALTTQAGRECAARPLRSENNLATQTVSASVPFDGGSVLVAVQAAPSGPAGDYSATSLQPSSTWTAGGNSGGFTWSYPMRVPPGIGGPTPSVGLSYASQAVDGRHAASNNQPSWVGEGFEAWPGGFIERRYRTCADDMVGSANNSEETGDQCWVRNNAVLSLNGTSGELLYNVSEDRWHLRSEDGSRIERRTGASNGDDNGEHWVVTTTDGTQYWFGVNRLPGWASGDPVTNSTWTVPVFGNHSGDPCHATAFADSDCTQAWRWNLDYVVDVHGNSMSYWYSTETNKYARNLDTADDATYIRGGWLRHISYGTRRIGGVDNVLEADAPMQVVFTPGDRCLSTCTTHDETRWPDTPWDQECTGTSCETFAPTFWTTKRLANVLTRVRNGSSYRNVERWTFTYTFPDPGDTTRAGLWLSRISHEGLANGTVGVPDIRFTPVSLDNRVDAIDHSPAMAWHRIARIDTETGGAIAVTYSDRDCEDSKPTLHTNIRRCYPVHWAPEGEQDPQLDWFHKYVVTELREVDMVGGQPEVIHRYEYLGGAAWHYTDDDGLIEDETRTWSVWRGYGRVTETVGEGDTRRTHTETRYFRGMDGDKLPSGTRSVNVTDSNGGTWPDEDWFAGMVREQITFNGPGGAEVSGQINDPWASSATASRTIDGSTVHARFTNTATVWSRTALDGGRPDRVTRVTTSFDSLGMPTQVDDHGATTISGDEQCLKHTYTPRNTTAWLLDKIHRTRSFAVGCAATADPVSLGDDDVITDVRNWFDGNGHGIAPTRGLVTRTEEMSAWNAGAPTYVTTGTSTYDDHGRVLEVRDALNRPTSTAYTPASGGPVTGSTLTNALGHVTTNTVDPAFGLATRTVDPNGKTTDMAYDGLGRLTGVWLPGRTTTAPANLTFAYGVRNTNVTFVTSRRLNAMGNYVTSHALYDGLLRQVQTQAHSPSIDGGRILTNTFYDNAGRAFQAYGSYYTTGNPSTTLHVPIEPLNVPTQTLTEYDGAGRVTAEVFRPYHQERWRTTTRYGGDRVHVTPPAGGTATTTINDARGRTVELRQYHAPTPTGTHDATSYEYDRKGQLVGVSDPAGNQWSYVYDLRGRQIEAHDPDTGLTRKEYDDADQLVGVIDGRNTHRLWYVYDELGRKRQLFRDSPDGSLLAVWAYDTLLKGQLSRMSRIVNSASYVTVFQGYNDWYQPTRVDIVIPAAETGLAGTYTTHYTYNEDGSPRSVAWTDTADLFNEGVHYDYHPIHGLPTTMRASSGAESWSYVADTAYNALGQVDRLTLRTSIESGTADTVRLGYHRELETGRMTNTWVGLDNSPGVVADTRYSYDPAGNITRIQDVNTNPDDTQCFGYDYLRRLSQAWTPTSGDCTTAPTTGGLGGPAPYWLSWTYDKAGNRLSQTDHRATGNVATTYTYPPAGSPQAHTLTSATTAGVTSNWTYDAGGNTLTRPDPDGGQQTLTWDREAHLSTVTDEEGSTRYIYDANGNRLIARDPNGKTLYLPGQEVRWDAATQTTECTRFYDYHGQIIASRTVDGLTWLAADHQGTTQVAITEQGQQVQQRRQTPFGTPRGATVPTWPTHKGFVGGDIDPTGLIHLGAREYDATIGRFISVDPIMDLTNAQQMQGYAYANNNPITWSDPSGLLCTPDGYNFCPDQPIRQQPTYDLPSNGGGGKSNVQCGSPTACDHWGNDQPYVLGGGMEEHGTTRTVWSDGTVDINGWILPPNAPNAAELAQLVDQLMFESGWTIDETYKTISFLCEEGAIKCDQEFMMQVWQRQLSVDAGIPWEILFWQSAAEALGGLGAVSGRSRGLSGPGGTRFVTPQQAFCRYNSFESGTLVLMADGSRKPIEDVDPGDTVVATDPETGKTEPKPVLGSIAVSGNKELVRATIADGELVGMEGHAATVGGMVRTLSAAITATENHPIWSVGDHQWIEAGDLQPGDQVRTRGDVKAFVVSVNRYDDTLTVYNLAVADIHTYYVMAGNVPILVHNCGGDTTTMGSRGNPFRGGAPNVATDINGRIYTGHALNRMQEQGIVPSVVEDTIMGPGIPGKRPGTTAYYSRANDVTVIVDTPSGRVITVDYGRIRQ